MMRYFLWLLLALLPLQVGRAGIIVSHPDISSLATTVEYNKPVTSPGKTFKAIGFSTLFQSSPLPGNTFGIAGGTININGTVGAVSGDKRLFDGTVEIKGRILGGPFSTPGVVTLLKGTLTGLKSFFDIATSGQDLFEIHFRVDSGASHLASLYGPTAATRIHAVTNADPSFDFDNGFFEATSPAFADTNPTVPEPKPLVVWSLLALSVGFFRARLGH